MVTAMRIKINRALGFYDEYIYKILFVVFGILYWVYRLTPIVDLVLSALVLVALIPTFINFARIKKNDFRFVLSLLTLILGIATVAFCVNKRSTTVVLIYTLIKMIVLGFCSGNKSELRLEEELYTLFRLIVSIGTVILLVSLFTYFAGMSIPYVISSSDDATTLYVGISADKSALCGILANGNMLSNLCVIYLGCLLCLIEKLRYVSLKIIGYILVLLDLFAQIRTFSRGGLIGMLLVLGIYFWYKFKQIMSGSYGNRVFRAVFLIIAVTVVVLYLFIGGKINIFSVLNRTQDDFDRNTNIRLELWSAAIRATTSSLQSFLFGIGHGIKDTMKKFTKIVVSERLYTNVHNAYLQKALEFGVPSAIIMITYFYRMLKTGFESIRNSAGKDLTMKILFGTVSALLVTNLVESDMLGRSFEGTVVWIFAGYLYAISAKKSVPVKMPVER